MTKEEAEGYRAAEQPQQDDCPLVEFLCFKRYYVRMKKQIIWGLLACAGLIFSGCGSTKIALRDYSPVAVFSIIGSTQITWTSDSPEEYGQNQSGGVLGTLVNKFIDGDNPELTTAVERLDYADDSIRQILPELTGCEILDRNKVLASEAYADVSESHFNTLSALSSATNYKDLTTFSSKEIRGAMKELGIKTAVLLNFTFQKKIVTGNRWNGKACALVTMRVRLVNEKGKEYYKGTYTARSSEKIKISNRKYDKDALVESVKPVIDSLIRQFALSFDGLPEINEDEQESVLGQPIAIPLKPVEKPAETESVGNTELSAEQ